MKYLKILTLVFVLGALVMGMGRDANAGFVLALNDIAIGLGPEVIIVDGMPAGTPTKKGPSTLADLVADGIIMYSGSFGAFTLNVTTGVSKPAFGSIALPYMDLNDISISGGAGTLDLELTDTDFLMTSAFGKLSSEIGGTTTGTLSFQQFIDRSNNEFGIPPPASDIDGVVGGPFGPGAFADTQSKIVATPGLFSLTENVVIIHSGVGISSFDAQSQVLPVPEPSTLMLLGTGLLGIAGYARVKFGRKKKEA